MKRVLGMVVLTSLIFLSAASIRAQGSNSPSVAKRKYKHDAEIASVYEKAKDHTTVIMQLYRITDENTDRMLYPIPQLPYIAIGAAFGYPGRLLKTTAAAIDFKIRTDYEGPSLFRNKEMPELIAVVDGENISLGKTSLAGSKTATTIVRPRQITSELLVATFTYEGLLRLANAKTVSMKIGQLEFKLRENHLEALRDLSSRMAAQ
jgi:hypothetical protein